MVNCGGKSGALILCDQERPEEEETARAQERPREAAGRRGRLRAEKRVSADANFNDTVIMSSKLQNWENVIFCC